MQDPMGFQPMNVPSFPDQEQLKCPRCHSNNTKFCYYNNYNLSQPRHFCKNCRRYWTKGGVLRNIPVGGGTRKSTKRSSSSTNPKRQPNPAPDPSPPPTTSSTVLQQQQVVLKSRIQNSCSEADTIQMHASPVDHQDRKMMDIGGRFSSLLASNGQFGNLLQVSDLKTVQMDEFGDGEKLDTGRGMDQGSGLGESNRNGESYLDGTDTSCWTGSSNGCPDLSIYTPGSNFQQR